MRCGLSTFTYAWETGVPGYTRPRTPLSPLGLVDRAAAAGLDLVQFGDNLPLDSLGDRLPDLARHARDTGVSLEVGTRGATADNLRAYAAIATTVGSPFVRVVVDANDDRPSADEVVHRLTSVEGEFRSRGLTLAIENHDRFRVDELTSIIERCGDWVGICLDTVNSFGALEGPEVVIDALAPHTVNIHLKDFDVVRAPYAMGFSIVGRPLGAGRLDVPALLARIQEVGRAPTAVIELWTPFDGDVESTIRTERAWADESIDYARTL